MKSNDPELLKETKHLSFYLEERKPKTIIVKVENKSMEDLGIIKWYAPWRQYCYMGECDIILAKSCLQDIQEFITELMERRKNEKDMWGYW